MRRAVVWGGRALVRMNGVGGGTYDPRHFVVEIDYADIVEMTM
jgi:hypothetical protein